MLNAEIFDGTSTFDAIAFVDDGCSTHALMDRNFATQIGIGVAPLVTSLSVTLADGSSAGIIDSQTVPLVLRLGGHSEKIQFYITKLVNPITLGLP